MQDTLQLYWPYCVSCSVVSGSLKPHGLYPVRHLCSRDFSGKNTGVGSHSLLQGIEPMTQVSCIAGRFYHLSHHRNLLTLLIFFKCDVFSWFRVLELLFLFTLPPEGHIAAIPNFFKSLYFFFIGIFFQHVRPDAYFPVCLWIIFTSLNVSSMKITILVDLVSTFST